MRCSFISPIEVGRRHESAITGKAATEAEADLGD